MSSTKPNDSERVNWSLRPPDDIQTLVAEALQATGWTRQRFIFECVRERGPAIVKRVAQAQYKAAQKFADR